MQLWKLAHQPISRQFKRLPAARAAGYDGSEVHAVILGGGISAAHPGPGDRSARLWGAGNRQSSAGQAQETTARGGRRSDGPETARRW